MLQNKMTQHVLSESTQYNPSNIFTYQGSYFVTTFVQLSLLFLTILKYNNNPKIIMKIQNHFLSVLFYHVQTD